MKCNQSRRGPESDGNEGVLRIPQSSSITGASPSDFLMSYPGHFCYPSSAKQSVYSTAPADWALKIWIMMKKSVIEKMQIVKLKITHANQNSNEQMVWHEVGKNYQRLQNT